MAAIEPARRRLHARSFGKHHVVRGQLVDEARRDRAHPLTVPVPVGREEDMGAAAGAGEPDIGEAAFLLQPGGARLVERQLMGEQPFLPARQEHGVELEALGAMQGHDVDHLFRSVSLPVHDEAHVVEEGDEVLEFGERLDQLLQVFEPAGGGG